MALYHIHKSGKHVNKKAADNFKNQNQKLWKNWNEVLAAQLKNTNFERQTVSVQKPVL